MAEYIDREAVLKILADNCPNDKGGYNTEEEMGAGLACYYIRRAVEIVPTADVVPKSEVERLTINMNAYGLTAKRLAEENESLEIELENMRRNLGDAREGWNDAECEVERLRKPLMNTKKQAD